MSKQKKKYPDWVYGVEKRKTGIYSATYYVVVGSETKALEKNEPVNIELDEDDYIDIDLTPSDFLGFCGLTEKKKDFVVVLLEREDASLVDAVGLISHEAAHVSLTLLASIGFHSDSLYDEQEPFAYLLDYFTRSFLEIYLTYGKNANYKNIPNLL